MSTRKKAAFDHSGSSFDSFLEEEGILDEVETAAINGRAHGHEPLAA